AGFIPRSEVDYYSHDYLGLVDAPIPKCYAAQVNDNVSYSILMEDLSPIHQRDSPPSLKYGLAVATALARLHAFGLSQPLRQMSLQWSLACFVDRAAIKISLLRSLSESAWLTKIQNRPRRPILSRKAQRVRSNDRS